MDKEKKAVEYKFDYKGKGQFMISREYGLCWECKEYARENNVIIVPWDHCFHEPREKPKCYCEQRKRIKGFYVNIDIDPVQINFCPQCGKELE